MRFSLQQSTLVRIFRVQFVCGIAFAALILPLVRLARAIRRAATSYADIWRVAHHHARWFLETSKDASTLEEAVRIGKRLPPDVGPGTPTVSPVVLPSRWPPPDLN